MLTFSKYYRAGLKGIGFPGNIEWLNMDDRDTDDPSIVIERIKTAFVGAERPVPVGEDIDNYWLALDSLIEPERAANYKSDYELIVQLWPGSVIGYDTEISSWALPRLMSATLRDGLLNAPSS